MNPYQWLGLDPQIKNPNHFVLLGIRPQVADEASFALLVKQQVKEKLDLLNRAELSGHAEAVDKLRKRIRLAGETLLDPQQRANYLQQLKSAARPPLAREQSTPTTRLTASSGSPTPAPAPPASSNHSGPSPAPPISTTAAAKDRPPSARPASQDEEIPLAIPIRKPAAPQSREMEPMEPITDQRASESPFALTNQAQDNEAGGEFQLRTKTRLSARRSSRTSIVAACIVCLGAMGGLAFVAYTLSQRTTNANSVEDSKSAMDQAVRSNAEAVAKENLPDESAWKPPEQETSTPAETDADDSDGTPTLVTDNVRDPFEDAEPDAQESSDPSESADSDDPDSIEHDPSEGDPEMDMPSEPSTGQSETEPAAEALSLPERYWIERSLRRIRSNLRWQNPEGAAEALESLMKYAEARQDQLDSGDPVTGLYAGLIQRHAEVIQSVEGFWKQFESSVAEISSGQELTVSGKKISFVEYADDQLIVRGPGFNLRYQREQIPLELAIACAEQGTIADIPSWRFQLAAFLATQQDGPSKHRERIETLIKQSREDGHDDTFIREYLEHVSKFQELRQQLDLPSPDLTEKFKQTVAAEWDRELGTAGWSPRERFDLWIDWNATEGKEVGLQPSELFQAYLMALDSAYRTGLESNQAGLVAEAISEMGYLSPVNTDKLLLEGLGSIARQKLEVQQVVELGLVSDPLIERLAGDQALGTLAKRLQQRIETLERQHNISGTGQRFGALR